MSVAGTEELKRRQRMPNFSAVERDMLINLIGKYESIIENKRTDGTSTDEKNKGWAAITNSFNAGLVSNTSRTEDSLKIFYKNLKKNVRKKQLNKKKATYLTGGGPELNNLNDEEKKILSLINPKSIFGLTNTCDSDCLLTPSDNVGKEDELGHDVQGTVEAIEHECKKFKKASDLKRPMDASLVQNSDTVVSNNDDKIEVIYVEDNTVTNTGSQSQTIYNLPVHKENTPKRGLSFKRRRPTAVIKTMTSSVLGEKYEELANKKIELANCLKEEHKLRMTALQLDIEIKQKQLNALERETHN